MDKEVKDLIDYISKSNFVEFELEKDGLKIKLVKASAKSAVATPMTSETAIFNPTIQEAQTPDRSQQGVAETAGPSGEPESREPVAEEELLEVKSPIVGTFYRAANPEASPYVEVGDIVKKGQVLCLVEAMKLMNEIEAEVSGEMVDILVPNAHPVEYGQVLFKIRPAE